MMYPICLKDTHMTEKSLFQFTYLIGEYREVNYDLYPN